MKQKMLASAAASVFAAVVLAGAGYGGGPRHSVSDALMASASASAEPGTKVDPKTGRPVLYWHDPMVPNQHFDKPGKSPFIDMQLEPVFADDAGTSGVKIDPGLQQNLGIRYATARRQEVTEGFDAVGTTQFDESRADVVQSRVTGYIDHL